MKSMIRLLYLIIFIMLTSSCVGELRSASASKQAFDDLYLDCEMNSTVQFLPPQGEFRSGALINLSIRNTSTYPVVFPDDLNVKILNFISNDKKWVEIMNEASYIPSTDLYVMLEPVNSGLKSYLAVLFIPRFSSATALDARIVVNGNFYKDNKKTTECVGAYIDIKISP